MIVTHLLLLLEEDAGSAEVDEVVQVGDVDPDVLGLATSFAELGPKSTVISSTISTRGVE